MEKRLSKIYPLVIGADAPVLRTLAKAVVLTSEMRRLALDLIELMWEYDGVGLAAPQIGQSLRMFAYTQRDVSTKKRELLEEGVMINPRLVASSHDMIEETEWCLSLPGIEGEVERSLTITITYTDIRGKQHVKKATGFNARILLHELDHLDGILFIDKATKIVHKTHKKDA
jgi:peptide deformylase